MRQPCLSLVSCSYADLITLAGLWAGVWVFFAIGLAGAQDRVTTWNGFERHAFDVAGRPCWLTVPKTQAAGNPWVWRGQFPDFHAEVDIELLRVGVFVAYMNVDDQYGCDAALDLMDRFYEHLTRERGMNPKPALEAVSRGGLYAYRYAARHPERIACIYADTPVMDIKSWPAGKGKGLGDRGTWGHLMKVYGFKSEEEALAWRGNPIDLLELIAQAKIPLRHVISLSDRVVPPEENTLEAKRRLEKLGHTIDLVEVKEGTRESNGHHFPLPAVPETAQFILRHLRVAK